MSARLWTATVADYVRAVYDSWPRGRIWSRDTSGLLYAYAQGIADELTRIHNSATDLMDEADPQTTTQLLDEWEATCGLPECADTVPPPTSDADRRLSIVAKLAAQGGASADYFVALAAELGATITVTEPLAWLQVWQVTGSDFTRAGCESPCDVPLVTATDVGARVRCMFEKFKPAHTRIWWT